MAARKFLALAVFVAPLVSASPVQRRADADFDPAPSNTWLFPGAPTGTPGNPGGIIQPDPVWPGGPITPDPVWPGGPITPDPVSPGAPIVADPTSPGGELTPDDPSYGDDDSTFHVGRAVEDDPPPTFGFGVPAPPTISSGPLIPGGPLNGDGGDGGWPQPSFGGLSSPLSPRAGDVDVARDIDNDGSRPAQRGVEVKSVAIAAAAAACTYTLDVASAIHLPAPCTWDGTVTQFASTATVVQAVDCHGCDHLRIVGNTYACPAFIIRGTTNVDTATTIFRTKCAALAATATATATTTGAGAAVPVAAGAAEPT